MNGGSFGWIVAALIAAALVGLVLLARTRWLQSDTLKKCVVLSVGVHLLLAAVAAGIGGMRPASWGTADEGRMTMMVVLFVASTLIVTSLLSSPYRRLCLWLSSSLLSIERSAKSFSSS